MRDAVNRIIDEQAENFMAFYGYQAGRIGALNDLCARRPPGLKLLASQQPIRLTMCNRLVAYTPPNTLYGKPLFSLGYGIGSLQSPLQVEVSRRVISGKGLRGAELRVPMQSAIK